MGRPRAIRDLAFSAALIALCLVWTAAASATTNTVVGFDDLSTGTSVTNQYQSDGVQFGTAADLGLVSPGKGDCGAPTVASGAVPAFSSPNYASLATCGPIGAGPTQYAGTVGKLLDYPRGSVTVEVRNLGSGSPVAMSIYGYDSSGNVVATGSAQAQSGAWTALTATQSSGGPVPAQITWFEITTSTAAGSPPAVAIDDLGFDHAGAPLSVTGASVSAQAGASFSGAVATIADGDATAVASDYSATLGWGDGATSAGVVSAAPGGGFTVTGTHTWAAAGSYTVNVSVTKINGRTASASTTATVAAPGPTQSGPTATLALTAPNPVAGGAVGFTGGGSTPGSGKIVSYNWDFNGDGQPDTSTGTNPDARFVFAPGVHTVGLTVTNSSGQSSTTHLTFTTVPPSIPPLFKPDGGQGPCQPNYDNGNVHILADCVQTLPGGAYVIETRLLDLNGMVLAPTAGGYGIFQITPFDELGIGSGTRLTGPAVNVELLNTPIGDLTIGGRDLTADPIQLTFQAFVPPRVLRFGARGAAAGDPVARAADSGAKTLLMSLGVGHSCSAGSRDPSCCPPPGPTSACATLPGNFPLTGTVNVYLNNKAQVLMDVQVGLDLAAVNFQATGALEVVADLQSGIDLSSLQFSIPEAGLASIFEVRDASFTYHWPSDPDASRRDTWQAKAKFVFGPLSQPSLAAELDFRKGQFHYASMTFTAPPGTGVPIYPGILVNQVGGSVGVNPLTFGGQLGASIAQELELSLGFRYADATGTQLGFFGGQGTLSLSGDQIATLAADVYSDGYTDAALSVNLHFPFDSGDPVVSVTGSVGFWDEPTSGRWEADGSVAMKLWVISAEVAGLINNQYVAGCADVSGFGVQGRYRFSDGNIDGGLFGFSNCSDQLKPYRQQPVTPHTGGFVSNVVSAPRDVALTAAATRGGGTIRLPGGTQGQEILVGSSSGTPVLDIYGPGHRRYATPSAPGQVSTLGGDFISAIAPDGHHVIIFLRHPAGGLYNIQPTAASAPIASVASAQDVPPARVRVRVKRSRGPRWTLSYRISDYVPGTRVEFAERGRDSGHVLATVRRPAGVIPFVPEDALGRRRSIVAYLRSASGAPLRTIVAGRYTAPPAIRPGRARSARFGRGAGSTAALTWSPAPGARRYAITIHGSDGRIVSLLASPSRRRVVLGEVLAGERLRASIVPEGGPNMLPGPATVARLAPARVGLVALLRCARGRCAGPVAVGSLVLGGAEVRVTLSRGAAVVARGIANGPAGSAVSVAVRRSLPRGRYRLALSWGHGRSRRRHVVTITID